jgi:hypothetical protein
MHVVAFAPALRAVLDEGGGVTAEGFPMSSVSVTSFPADMTIPLVLAVYTQGGTDYNVRRYIVARAPDGHRVSTIECSWQWPDRPGSPVKFWVVNRHLQMTVESAGVYTIGLYETPDGTESDHLFPLPVAKINPFANPSQPSSGV